MKVENSKRFSLKTLRCEAIERFLLVWHTDMSAIFYSVENVHTMNLDYVASGHFVLGRDVHCEFDCWPLAVSMAPTKVCPQSRAHDDVISYCGGRRKSV